MTILSYAQLWVFLFLTFYTVIHHSISPVKHVCPAEATTQKWLHYFAFGFYFVQSDVRFVTLNLLMQHEPFSPVSVVLLLEGSWGVHS